MPGRYEGPAGSNHYHPGLSVAPDGRLGVAWYDFRNDPGWDPDPPEGGTGTQETEEHWDVYLSSSDNSGQTWSPAIRVTDRFVLSEHGTLPGPRPFGPAGDLTSSAPRSPR